MSNDLPRTLVIGGDTYHYIAPMDQCVPGYLHVYQAYVSDDESPVVLLTAEQARSIAGGGAFINPEYRWGSRCYNLNDLRINWANYEWLKEHRRYAIAAVSTSVPMFLEIDHELYQLNKDQYNAFDQRHGYMRSYSPDGTHLVFLTPDEIQGYLDWMMRCVDLTHPISHSRKTGYECSSLGDRRFSAFNAIMPDDRSIEMWYQCGTLDGRGKGFDPGGTNWRLGKGKVPTVDKGKELRWQEYYDFWDEWAQLHPVWMRELRWHASQNDYTLRDSFSSTLINQARALAQWLNENSDSILTE